MVSRIIEFCARNRLVVLFGVAIATLAAALVDLAHQARRHPRPLRPAGHRLHRVDGPQPHARRGPGHLPDRLGADLGAQGGRRARLLDVRHVLRLRDLRGGHRHVLGPQPGARVRSAPSRARLPDGVVPTLGPDATGIGWVFQYTLVDKSGQHVLDELRTFQDFTLRYALGSVPGVAEVASVGGYQKQYQVTVDPNRLRAYGVTLEEVVAGHPRLQQRRGRAGHRDVRPRVLRARPRLRPGPRRPRATCGEGQRPLRRAGAAARRGHGALRPRHPARRCSSGTARARRWAASW